jgi:cytochrome c-type biogenesis protein CcmH
VGLYYKIGNLDAFLPPAVHGAGGVAHDEAGLKALEEKSARNPDDPEALVLLARSYSDLGRYVDAASAYERLTQIVTDEPILWTDYAEALAMTHGSLQGGPTKLLERALELNPNHPKALALSGTAAMERGDHAAAVRHWERLLKLIPPEYGEDIRMVKESIGQARQMLAQSKGGKAALQQIDKAPRATAGRERISGTVTLSDALKGKADPDDTLFVLARAAQGPKMPLAILRKQVKDLPLRFTLDDSMAMSPEMKMSNFDEVVVVARISRSGDAIPKPGDLQGMSKPLALGSTGIRIDIDQPIR